jgi:hypothetical protein
VDPHHLSYLHLCVDQTRQSREAAAAADRLARTCRRPSPVLRIYARLWWASRPRAAAWTPGLFETPQRM